MCLVVDQRRACHAGSKVAAQGGQKPGLLGQKPGGQNIVVGTGRDTRLEVDGGQQAHADPCRMPITGKRHHRHPHPQGLAGGGGAVVRECVERKVDLVVEAQMIIGPGHVGGETNAARIDSPIAEMSPNELLRGFTGTAAPLQMTYVGYPNTTGFPSIDYRITDGIADPDDADDHYTETLIRLPRCFLCYAVPTSAPDVGPPPHERNGCVTFGSFNNFAKLNRKVLDLWSDVLAAVPSSRLVLKAGGSCREGHQAR